MCKIIFTKYSNDRAGRFALRTDILEDDKKQRYVRKRPLSEACTEHIRNIVRWHEDLKAAYAGTKIQVDACESRPDGLYLEYLEGDTLEHVLDGYLLEGNTEKLIRVLDEYLSEVKKGFTLPEFQMTEKFQEVFGTVSLPKELLCGRVTDVDMVLNNVVVHKGWTLIDYEWSFDFPIPYHFVAYRILSYYLNGSNSRRPLRSLGLYERAGLTEKEMEIYENMERHFQDVYVVSEEGSGKRHMPLRDLHREISPGTVDLTELHFMEQRERENRQVQLYEAPDEKWSFTEEHCQNREASENGIFSGTFTVGEQSRFVRLDPSLGSCIVRKLKIVWGQEVTPCYTNGILGKDGNLFFAMDDPQMIIERPQGAGKELKVSFQAEYLKQAEALRYLQECYQRQSHRLARTEAKLKQKEALIHEMENTKVWKAYRKIKGKS